MIITKTVANLNKSIWYTNLKYLYLMYSLSLYVSITNPILHWKEYFSCNNIIEFFAHHFIKNIKYVNDDYTFAGYSLMCHVAISLAYLSIIFVIDVFSVIYCIVVGTSIVICIIAICIIVVVCICHIMVLVEQQ